MIAAPGMNPNLSGTAVIPSSVLGHHAFVPYGPNPAGGPRPPTHMHPGQPIHWPPDRPQPIPATLLRLPDLVAEKLKLCGIIVIYQTNSDEYQLILGSPKYVQMHIKHDASAELWEAAMKYMIEQGAKPLNAGPMVETLPHS